MSRPSAKPWYNSVLNVQAAFTGNEPSGVLGWMITNSTSSERRPQHSGLTCVFTINNLSEDRYPVARSSFKRAGSGSTSAPSQCSSAVKPGPGKTSWNCVKCAIWYLLHVKTSKMSAAYE
eukprot:3922601-Rhodomonas_salina.1